MRSQCWWRPICFSVSSDSAFWCQGLSLRRCRQPSRSPPRMEILSLASLPSPRRSRFHDAHRGPRHSYGCLIFGARLTFYLRLFKAYGFRLILVRSEPHSSFQRRSCHLCLSLMPSSSDFSSGRNELVSTCSQFTGDRSHKEVAHTPSESSPPVRL